MTNEPLLIEDYLPIREISDESDREKKAGRAYHPSTLHWWWARRPLAAARAAVLATLVPRSAFPEDTAEIAGFFRTLTAWKGGEAGLSSVALARARELISQAWPDHPPRVIDCFAGGGAIPLEVLRLGGEAAAVDLNPVAWLVATATLVWPQTYGVTLADDVESWGQWILDRAVKEVADLYPPLEDTNDAARNRQLDFQGVEQNADLVPLVYLWTRTVPCRNPAWPPHRVPLIRSTHVVRTDRKKIRVNVVPDPKTATFHFRLEPDSGQGGAIKRGKTSSSACQLCGASLPAKYIEAQGNKRQIGFQLVAVVAGRPGKQGKVYLDADAATAAVPEDAVLDQRLAELDKEGLTPPSEPVRPMGNAGLVSGKSYLYGIPTYLELFTKRQYATLLTLCKYVRQAREEMIAGGMPGDRADVVAAYLGLAVNRVVDRSTALSRWHLKGEKLESPFVRDRLAMMWDFGEVNPFAGISGDVSAAVDSVAKVIRHCARVGPPADVRRGNATELPFDDTSFDAAIIDPPYYDNVSYAHSSDFYYVWLKRSIGHLFPEHFSGPVAPARNEIIAAAYRHGKNEKAARAEYEQLMTDALRQLRRVLKPDAPLVVVYAHQTTSGWSALIGSLRTAGFAVVEAWPVETEMTTRRGGQENASLASSIFLVARRRESEAIGDWTQVQEQFERVIAERVRTLPSMGIAGADLVIASIGAGLRPYTAYRAVELPNGERLEPAEFLDEVQTAVLKTILSDLLGISRAGVEAVDPITQFYILGHFEYGDAFVAFDEMNTMVHGVLAGGRAGGVELVGPRGLGTGPDALVEQQKDRVRMRDFDDRGHVENLGLAQDAEPMPLIDILHRVLWLAEHQPSRVREFLDAANPDGGKLQTLAQALSGSGLSNKGVGTSEREQAAAQRLLASWKHLIEDNLFRSSR